MAGYNLARMEAITKGADIHEMNLRVVDYVRVSTCSPQQHSSFENQLETYREMIQRTPSWHYAGTYSDDAVTGTKALLRKGFRQMIRDAQCGLFDLIIVKDISRFARNLKECLMYVDILKGCGVMVWFYNDHINSFSGNDEIKLRFMALGAEMEARSVRSRTKIVFEQGIEHGRIYGNSKILGYTKSNCSLVVDEAEAEIVRLIFDLYVHERKGLRAIEKELSVRGLTRRNHTPIKATTIGTVLKNPKYKGYYCGKKTQKIDVGERYVRRNLPQSEWILYRDERIPALVSEEIWDEAARIRSARSSQSGRCASSPRNQGSYPYSSKIEWECLPSVHYHHVFYRYKAVKRDAWQVRSPCNPPLSAPTLYSDELDHVLRNFLAELAGGMNSVTEDLYLHYQHASQLGSDDALQANILQKMQSIRARNSRLLDLYQEGAVSKETFIAQHRCNNNNLHALSIELTTIQDAAKQAQLLSQQPDRLRADIQACADQLSFSRAFIDKLVRKIIVCSHSTRSRIELDIVLSVGNISFHSTICRSRSGSDQKVFCNLCNTHTSTPV